MVYNIFKSYKVADMAFSKILKFFKPHKDNPLEFHRQNLAKNKDDYSYFMKAKSADSISNWNSKATGLYFNQFVKTEFGELKYGVISTQDFIKDLTNWHHLYIAGRLHKPVKVM